jgi:hypothetical protein
VPDEVFVANFGKYSGKTLGEIQANDAKYFAYMRAYTKDETVKARIERMLKKNEPPAPVPMMAQVQAAAPVVPPTPVQVPMFVPPTPMTTAPAPAIGKDPGREEVLANIRQLISSTPKFTGRGMLATLIPFIKSTINVIDYTDAPLPDLQKLYPALQQKALEP